MLNTQKIVEDVRRALEEDIGSGDVSAELLPGDEQVRAEIIARESFAMAGRAWADAVFRAVDPNLQLQWQVEDGQYYPANTLLLRIEGLARSILTAERTALNFLQTLSATATITRRYVDAIYGTGARLLDTRKTLPGLRYAQKYAVRMGGGENHRMGLYDAYLIKENHIRAAGSISKAIACARVKNPELFLEVEVETLAELQEALALRPDRILLDNFTLDMLREAVALNQPKTSLLEASGGVNLSTIRQIALSGVDYISVGDLTKSIHAVDLSLLIRDVL